MLQYLSDDPSPLSGYVVRSALWQYAPVISHVPVGVGGEVERPLQQSKQVDVDAKVVGAIAAVLIAVLYSQVRGPFGEDRS